MTKGKFVDISGVRFGSLTVIRKTRIWTGKPMWQCLCDCGEEKEVRVDHIRTGVTKDCGCAYKGKTGLSKFAMPDSKPEIGCIEHNQKGDRNGYGSTQYQGITTKIHRVAFCLFHRIDILSIKGVIIRHTCDNPRCFNPRHLLSGSFQDNSNDMKERSRQVRGEEAKKSELKIKDILSIRKEYAMGNSSQYKVGEKYGVAHSTIGRIVRGESWGHI